MKKFKVEKALTLNHGTLVGLTATQAADRASLLKKSEVKGLPAGVSAFVVDKPVQFKAGETIYADEIPKSLAAQVVESEEPGAESAEKKGKK